MCIYLFYDHCFFFLPYLQNPGHSNYQARDQRIFGTYNSLGDSIQSYGSSSHHDNSNPTSSTTRNESQPSVSRASTTPHHPSMTVLSGPRASVPGPGALGNSLPFTSNYPHPFVPAPSKGVPAVVSAGHPPVNPDSDSQATLNGLSTLETQLESAKSSKEISGMPVFSFCQEKKRSSTV